MATQTKQSKNGHTKTRSWGLGVGTAYMLKHSFCLLRENGMNCKYIYILRIFIMLHIVSVDCFVLCCVIVCLCIVSLTNSQKMYEAFSSFKSALNNPLF